jgi:hypothetical protein
MRVVCLANGSASADKPISLWERVRSAQASRPRAQTELNQDSAPYLCRVALGRRDSTKARTSSNCPRPKVTDRAKRFCASTHFVERRSSELDDLLEA